MGGRGPGRGATWAFSSPSIPHYVILVGVGVVGIFCGIEAHRYRGYDI